MSIITVNGPAILRGEAYISSAKNAVLPIMAATLLCEKDCVIRDVPSLSDVETMAEILVSLGAQVKREGRDFIINASSVNVTDVPYYYAHKMRASILALGPLLARFGIATISLPGGCAIGTRPVDLHLKGLKMMGADLKQGLGHIMASGKLKGANIYLDLPSVGATENLMMAASISEGTTVIENAAKEPEIGDLAAFLNAMGAKVSGAGTDSIWIEGVKSLNGAFHKPISDRIEAATFMVAAAATRGDVTLRNINPRHVRAVSAKLRQSGALISETGDGIRVRGKRILPVNVSTLTYPGFPTDAQAQISALLSQASGTSIIHEGLFENRFMHMAELRRMGANIVVEDRTAIIHGVKSLFGADVRATDLRAGAALVMAGLAAQGQTRVLDAHHIKRGYDDITGKFKALGADIA